MSFKMKKKMQREMGFFTAKTSVLTAGGLLATAAISLTVATSFASPSSIATINSLGNTGICVEAVLLDSPHVKHQRGYCGSNEIPEIPEIENPDPTEPPLPTEPVIPPEPTDPPEPTEPPLPTEPVVPPEPTEPPKPVEPPTPIVDTDPIMVTTWNTGIGNLCTQITLPISGTVSGTVKWGKDAEPVALKASSNVSPVLKDDELIEVTIEGVFNKWGGYNWGDNNCLVSVDRWGETKTTDLTYAFHNTPNLKNVKRIPETTKLLHRAFENNKNDFTIGAFNTSNVTDMSYMFYDATSFNQFVNFDTANVANMSYMFYGAKKFNHPVNFSTSNVSNMSFMFYSYDKSIFNQPLNFSTSKVTNMSFMLAGQEFFNKTVTFNDTSKVTNMQSMLLNTKLFNQDLSGWTVNQVSSRANFANGSGLTAENLPKFIK